MAKKKALPKKLFMCWSTDDEPFLDHSEDPDLLAETGRTVTVGVYELKKKVRLVNRTEIMPTRS